jgi:hypothetical protein
MTDQTASLAGTPTATERCSIESLEAEQATLLTCAVGKAAVGSLSCDTSALGYVSVSGDAGLAWSAAGLVTARRGGEVERALVGVVAAGEGIAMTQAGADLILAGGDVTLDRSGAGAVLARSVSITDGWVGIVASGDANIAGDATVLLGPREAVTFAAVLGVVFALVFSAILAFRR